jgi:hypothetical protein
LAIASDRQEDHGLLLEGHRGCQRGHCLVA